MTKINVKHIAKLANLSISEEKLSKFEEQLNSTIKHIERLNTIDTSRVSGTNEVTDLKNITRSDTVSPSFTQEEALRNAKRTHKGFFLVPIIIEEAIE